MKAIVIFHSYFGNTEKISKAIADGVNKYIKTELFSVLNEGGIDLSVYDLIILGSPTRAFRPTKELIALLKKEGKAGLSGKHAASFDTRMSLDHIKSKSGRFFVDKGGYAAKHISKLIRKAGFDEISEPKGFLVSGEEGPLIDGEIDKAVKWGESLALSLVKTKKNA